MKNFGVILAIIFTLNVTDSWGQDSFQRNRRAFQRAQYNKKTSRYGKACSIFQKRSDKGVRKPIINLHFGRKPKSKQAEQD